MIDLSIDTCTLVDASGKGLAEHQAASIGLLREFETDPELILVVDKNGFVLHEYDDNINASMFATAWLKQHAGRILKVDTRPIPRGLRVQLDELHFSVRDRRFVQVALASASRLIVTREPDFSPPVCQVLRREAHILVLGPAEALSYIRAIRERPPCADV